jgi:NADPH:quinone reductase-like Zn-dependent oxidoreductase
MIGPKSVERLKSLGCDHVIDYTRDDYHTLYSGQGAFDYFLDCQGGVASDARGEQRYNDDEAKAASILKRGGHLATFRGALMRSINSAPNVVQGLAHGSLTIFYYPSTYLPPIPRYLRWLIG